MRKSWILILAATALAVASCGSAKKLTYLQDMDTETTYQVAEQPDAKIGVNDKLKIVVTCQEPSLAAPFNLASGTYSLDPNSGEVKSNLYPETDHGYVVSKDGTIDFPVLGDVYVRGLTLEQLRETLTQKIIDTKFVKEPIVLVEFLNFQFTVLGEASPGNYIVPNGHINLIEALAMAGDLKTSAKRDDVWVIRTQDGERKVYSVNMRSKDLYDSPAFYIQQNDLIYVKPLKSVKDSDAEKKAKVGSTIISLLSTVSSITLALVYAGVISK